MNAPTGIGMWIAWNAIRTTSAPDASLVEQAKRAGLSWVALKSGDSDRGRIWLARGKKLVDAFHAAGIQVFTWNYSYPNTTDAQVEHIARNFGDGVDGHILDAETEWEFAPGVRGFSGRDERRNAEAFMAKLRSRVGDDAFLAHAPIWDPHMHATFPYVEFGSRCNAVMPQFYWTMATDKGAAAFCGHADAAWSALTMRSPEAVPRMMPIGISYGDGDGWDKSAGKLMAYDVDAFVQRYQPGPVSFFSWDAASKACWAVLEGYATAATIAGAALSGLDYWHLPDTEPGEG